ncbi:MULTISPECIES: hypothetical protein [Micrococcales]|uniref:Uncharacterized protein n=2 Tax=Micrococcales TaxID=85006 RepID=A0A1W2BND5_9MICO|nr:MULTISPECIES: hypothetical protein [Micrococcales]MCL6422284.1 hypothetical protein [Brachybacterium equifaecis]RYI20557.1 hypothetical protein EVU97_14070 [Dermacoccus sp. 147Ba]SMC74390.1 hypothetical protein SAMN06296429_108181 [Janibacter indicus]
MNTTDDSHARRRLVAWIIAGIALLVLIAVGVYGLLIGPPDTDTPPAPAPSERTVGPPPSEKLTPRLPVIIATDDPEGFARSVAEALFTWDTGDGLMPADYSSVIVEVGDPTGYEQAGLASDISTYLPSREAWIELRKHSTSQYLSIETAAVPEAWAEAVDQAQPGQLPEGATAITIEGTRHREGIWQDDPVSSEHSVAFTIFLACPEDADSCHLLRLSELDNPLR